MSREDDARITKVGPRDPVEPSGEPSPYLVVMSGRAVGRMYRLRAEGLVLGRSSSADVVLDDEGVSRHHAKIEIVDGRVRVRDLDSTNGTFVEAERVNADPVELEDGNRVRLGPVSVVKYGLQDTVEREFLARLYRSATRDPLTGVSNRRVFLDQLDQEFAWHRRHGEPLTLMLIDVDHFKSVNDSHGHPAGDQVLKQVAALLDGTCRTEDRLARYGGEEFAILLRQTSSEEGQAIAGRLLRAISGHTFAAGTSTLRLTVSIGMVTHAGADLTTAESLLQEADDQLYRAKAEGRNCVRHTP